MIEMLVDNDIDSIMADAGDKDLSCLAEILCTGFKGYENFTDDELVQEMNERELWNEWFKESA
jgi:hypothetical protein